MFIPVLIRKEGTTEEGLLIIVVVVELSCNEYAETATAGFVSDGIGSYS